MSTENTNETYKPSTDVRSLKTAASETFLYLMQVIQNQEQAICHLNSLLVAHSDRILQLEQKMDKLAESGSVSLRLRLDELDAACSQRLNELEAKVGDLDADDIDRDLNRIGERLTDLECAMDDKADASDLISEDSVEEIATELVERKLESDALGKQVRAAVQTLDASVCKDMVVVGLKLITEEATRNVRI